MWESALSISKVCGKGGKRGLGSNGKNRYRKIPISVPLLPRPRIEDGKQEQMTVRINDCEYESRRHDSDFKAL